MTQSSILRDAARRLNTYSSFSEKHGVDLGKCLGGKVSSIIMEKSYCWAHPDEIAWGGEGPHCHISQSII